MIGETHTKSLPVCYHGQSSVLAAMELRVRVRVQDIESIEVDTYPTAVAMMGGDATRWAPTTRETADHSLPYTIAVALIEGGVNNQSYAPAKLSDPAIAAVMRKVKVREDARLAGYYPEGAPGRVTIRSVAGEAHTAEIRYPTGHAKNAMSDADVERKFRDMAATRLDSARCDAVLEAVRNLERSGDVARDLLRLLTPRKGSSS